MKRRAWALTKTTMIEPRGRLDWSVRLSVLIALLLIAAACSSGTEQTPTTSSDSSSTPTDTAAGSPTTTGDSSTQPTGGDAGDASVIRVAIDQVTPTIDPMHSKPHSGHVASFALQGRPLTQLFEEQDGGWFKGVNEIGPELAESVSASADGMEVSITLRDDIHWESGEAITAADLEWSLRRVFAEQAYHTGLTAFMGIDNPEQIEAIDDRTVVISPNVPNPPLLQRLLTLPIFPIMHSGLGEEHSTEADPWAFDWFSKNAMASGPFRLAEWVEDEYMIFERNPEYISDELPAADRIQMQFIPDTDQRLLLLKNGDIDVTTRLSPRLLAEEVEGDPNLTIYSAPSANLIYLGMNVNIPPLDDVRVRQAIAHAVPYDVIIDQVMYGYAEPALSVVTPPMETHGGSELHSYDTDLDRARTLLEEAGYSAGGTPLEFVIKAGRSPDNEAAIFIQDSLRQIGIDVEITAIPDADWFARMEGDGAPLFIHDYLSWGGDPFYQMNFLVRTGSNRNFSKWSNARVDEIIDVGMYESDQATRDALSLEAQNIVLDEAVMAPLIVPSWTVTTRNNIDGATLDWTELLRLDRLRKAG